MTKVFEKVLDKFEEACERLNRADNNLQYIKALKSMKFWAERLDQVCTKGNRYEEAVIMQIFFGSISQYERLLNSIEAYNYGERPF